MAFIKDKKLSLSTALIDSLKMDYFTLSFENNSYEEAYFDYRMDLYIKITFYIQIIVGIARLVVFSNLLLTYLFFNSSITLKDLIITLFRAIFVLVLCYYNEKPVWYKPVIFQILISLFYYYTFVIVGDEMTNLNCIAIIALRFVTCLSNHTWIISSFFILLDFSIFLIRELASKNLSVDLSALVASLSGTIVCFYLLDKKQRTNWYLQFKLDTLLQEESIRRINADKMIGFLSHEVRNPQNAIMMTAESLIIEAKSETSIFLPKHVDLFQLIFSSSEFVSSLLEDVLNFQRLSENKISLSFDPFELMPFLENLSLFLVKMFPLDSQITFETNFSKELPKVVYGDKFRIRQIITNFVSNAAKFSRSFGTVKFNVGIAENNNNDPLIKTIFFSVQDSGFGISSENKNILFQSYTQIDPNFHQQGKGAGLGLSICKGLVQLHGGTIGVNSELGIGSEFYCNIPFRFDDNLSESFGKINGNIAKSKLVHLKNVNIDDINKFACIRILIADDNIFVRNTLHRTISNMGYHCDRVDDGNVAVLKLKSENYDCLLIDNYMNVMDGITAVIEIRKFNKNIPIIGLTGESSEVETLKFKASGLNMILIKPVKSSELISALKSFFSPKTL